MTFGKKKEEPKPEVKKPEVKKPEVKKPEEKKPEEKKKQGDCLHLKARSLTFNLPIFFTALPCPKCNLFQKAKIMNGKVVVKPPIWAFQIANRINIH